LRHQFAVGVGDELVGHHAEGQEHGEERVDGTDNCLAPGGLAVDRAALAEGNDRESHGGGDDERDDECLVHSWPPEDVNRNHGRS